MKKRNIIKSVLAVTAVLSFALCATAKEAPTASNENWFVSVEQKAIASQQKHLAQHLANKHFVKTTWQLYDTKTASRRKVRVTVNWGKPQSIKTVCEALVLKGQLYVSAACYYPKKAENQNRVLVTNKLMSGADEIALQQPVQYRSGFVIFQLPAESSAAGAV